MSDEEEVALIERGEDGEVDPYKQNKEMVCLLCSNKSYTKYYLPNNNHNKKNKKKESFTIESPIIEDGDEEDILYGELLNWENLNRKDSEDYYSDEEEGNAVLN